MPEQALREHPERGWLEAALRALPDPRDIESSAEISFSPGAGGELRVLRLRAPGAAAVRPLVFVPGFGATIEGWRDFYGLLLGRVELVVIETLEKRSTRIDRGPADRSLGQMAADVERALKAQDLDDYALMGSCWGSTILMEGMRQGRFADAPTIALYDPMHSMWVSPFVLRYVAALLPSGLIDRLRGPIGAFFLRGMDQPVQRRRAESFIASADVWRWKTYARAAADVEMFGCLGEIDRELLVFNGSHDMVHDRAMYPRVAAELPRGRFFYMEVDEADRERLAAVIGAELAAVPAGAPPATLAAFEVPLQRG